MCLMHYHGFTATAELHIYIIYGTMKGRQLQVAVSDVAGSYDNA